jgi:hypothetical protein
VALNTVAVNTPLLNKESLPIRGEEFEPHTSSTPHLLAALREEAEKANVFYDFEDDAFVRKIERLADQVPREYEIIAAFRLFLSDPMRTVSPFWFPERFDKYRQKTRTVAENTPRSEPPALRCPNCGTRLYDHQEENLYSCTPCHGWYRLERGELMLVSVPGGESAASDLPWRRGGRSVREAAL